MGATVFFYVDLTGSFCCDFICFVLQWVGVLLWLKITLKISPDKHSYIDIKVWQTRNHSVA